MCLRRKAARRRATYTVSADVDKYRGQREADEVVQFYVHQDAASVSRPVRELKGFHRVHLKPGEKVNVQFPITPHDLLFYNQRMQFVTEPGTIHVWIAPPPREGPKDDSPSSNRVKIKKLRHFRAFYWLPIYSPRRQARRFSTISNTHGRC